MSVRVAILPHGDRSRGGRGRRGVGLLVGVVGGLDAWAEVAALAEHVVHRLHPDEQRVHLVGVEALVARGAGSGRVVGFDGGEAREGADGHLDVRVEQEASLGRSRPRAHLGQQRPDAGEEDRHDRASGALVDAEVLCRQLGEVDHRPLVASSLVLAWTRDRCPPRAAG